MKRTSTTAAIAALGLAGALAFAGPAAADHDHGGDHHRSRATTIHCGQTLKRSVKLANDLTDCPADGLVIGADGVDVDLNGHTIDGAVAPAADCDSAPREAVGINNSDADGRVYDRLTIENGTLRQFAQGLNAGSGTDGMADSRLRHLTVTDNVSAGLNMGNGGVRLTNHNRVEDNLITGTQCGHGIVVNSSDGSVVAGNTVRDNAAGILLCCSIHTAVRDNVVAHNSEEGIGVCCGPGMPEVPNGSDNLVERNDVLGNTQVGIGVAFGGQGVTVRRNHVAGNGDNIVVADSSDNTIAQNHVTDAVGDTAAPPPTGFGILVRDGAADNVLADNVVARTKEDAIRIFDFDPADPANPVPTRTTVHGNVMRDAGVDGVHVDATTTDTALEHNRVFGAGDDGIHVDSASTVLTANLASFNHDLGIDAVSGITDGGANRARGNGNPAQCTGIVCG